jgi:hypothetical protein
MTTPAAMQALRERELKKSRAAAMVPRPGETPKERYERKAQEAMRRQREGGITPVPERKKPTGNMNIGMERRPRGKGDPTGEEGAILTDLLTLPLRLPYIVAKKAFVPPPGWVDPNSPTLPQNHRETMDKVYEHIQLGLLSAFGPLKQASDLVMIGLRPVELLTHASLDAARVALLGGDRQRFFAELPAWARGVAMSTAIPSRLGWGHTPGDDALSLAWQFFTEADQTNPVIYGPNADIHQRAIGGKYGYGVRIFHRTAGWGQGISQGLTRGGEKGVEAVREARSRGLSKAQTKAMVRRWTEMPLDMLPPTAEEHISRTETERTMVERLSGIWGFLNHGRLHHPAGRLIFPFFQFATNAMKVSFRRYGVPFNIPQLLLDMKSKRNRQTGVKAPPNIKTWGELEDRVGNILIGAAITISLVEIARRKLLNINAGNIGMGASTKDYQQQEAGMTPWTFSLPGADWNIPMEMLGPAVAPAFALAAAYVKATEDEKTQSQPGMKKESNLIAWHLFNAQVESISASYLRDLHDVFAIIRAPRDPEAAARLERMFGKTSVGIGVPRLIGRAANAMDSDAQGRGIQRVTNDPGGSTLKTVGNYFKRDIPGLREDLPKLKSRTGEVVKDPRSPAERFLAPWKRTPTYKGTHLMEKEFARLGWVPPGIPKKLNIPDQDGAPMEVILNQDQIDALYGAQAAATQQAEEFMQTQDYRELPDWLKLKVLKKIYGAGRAGAFGALRGELLEDE